MSIHQDGGMFYASTSEELRELVCAKLKEGWECVGKPSYMPGFIVLKDKSWQQLAVPPIALASEWQIKHRLFCFEFDLRQEIYKERRKEEDRRMHEFQAAMLVHAMETKALYAMALNPNCFKPKPLISRVAKWLKSAFLK